MPIVYGPEQEGQIITYNTGGKFYQRVENGSLVTRSQNTRLPFASTAADLLAAGEGKGEQYFKDLGFSENLLNSLAGINPFDGSKYEKFALDLDRVANEISSRDYRNFNYGLEEVLRQKGFLREIIRPPTESEAPGIDTTVEAQAEDSGDPLKETSSIKGDRRRAGKKVPTLISLSDESRPTILGS